MLQVLHFDVSKVDQVLHLPSRLLLLTSVSPSRYAGWASVVSSLFLDAGDVLGGMGSA
jgi:hypothetical protein